jgi:hypothetical protein
MKGSPSYEGETMSKTSTYTKLALYEAAVLFHPPVNDGEERRTELILDPQTFLARDNDHAAMLAARAIPEAYADRLERCEVVVRPF